MTLPEPLTGHHASLLRRVAADDMRTLRRGPWAGLFVCATAGSLLLAQTASRVPYFAGDVTLTRAVQSADLRVLELPLRGLNALGFAPVVVIAYGSILLALLIAGLRWAAVSGAFGVGGGAGINQLVKTLVDRPRPSLHLVHVDRFIPFPSFPAGHVLNLTVFAGFLCCVVYLHARPSWRRTAGLMLLICAILLMGLARVQSGEHWPSDVLGGYLLGAAWLSVTALLYDWGHRRGLFMPGRVSTPRAGFVVIAVLIMTSPAWSAPAAHAGAAPDDSLASSVDAPWNPPEPLARRTGWEQVVLLPGRLVSLPLVGIGRASESLLSQVEQRPMFANLMTHQKGSARGAVTVGNARLGDRTGLGARVELHTMLLRGAQSSRLAAEYTGTLHQYGRTLLTWTGRPLSLQFGEEWRPQERFYGPGNASLEGEASDYAVSHEFVRGGLAWASNPEHDPRRGRSELGIWAGPRSTVTRTGRETGVPSYDVRFPALGSLTLNRRVERLVYGARVLRDARSGSPHWSRGWRTLLSAERFDAPVHAFALRSTSDDGATFTRYQAEAEAGASFRRDPRTLRVLVKMTDLVAGSHGDRLLPSDLSTLGGQPGLGGFTPGRFHDMDLLLTRLDYVFPLQRNFEVDLHSEWGGVYPDLWRDAALRTLHNSFGFALRARGSQSPNASIGCDFSREGARLRFSLGGTE